MNGQQVYVVIQVPDHDDAPTIHGVFSDLRSAVEIFRMIIDDRRQSGVWCRTDAVMQVRCDETSYVIEQHSLLGVKP